MHVVAMFMYIAEFVDVIGYNKVVPPEINGPVTLLRIVLVCERISRVRWYTLTHVRGTLGIGCIRFKYGGIRRGRNLFLHA